MAHNTDNSGSSLHFKAKLKKKKKPFKLRVK